jgi:hypothetical protein
MLVQFLLREIATSTLPFMTDWTNRPERPLQVNGIADENLFQWIRSFQDNAASRNTADGVVDPAPSDHARTSITREPYTINQLNGSFLTAFPERYQNLPNDPGVPAALRQALRAVR